MALIANRQTKISSEVHPAAAYVILWAGIIWMTMVEGGQASMVGLPPVNPELYKESHKTTYYITTVGHKGDNLDRYVSLLFLNCFVSEQPIVVCILSCFRFRFDVSTLHRSSTLKLIAA
jgi:hypothetical protein